MRIHITLVGGQMMPVYLGIKNTELDKIILIHSSDSIKNAEQIEQLLSLSFFDLTTSCVIGGWLEYTDGANFEADLVVLKRMA